LALKIGTKQPSIARFESGDYNPTISFLKKISKALDSKLEIKI
jgi:predicted transcriptional regulator